MYVLSRMPSNGKSYQMIVGLVVSQNENIIDYRAHVLLVYGGSPVFPLPTAANRLHIFKLPICSCKLYDETL